MNPVTIKIYLNIFLSDITTTKISLFILNEQASSTLLAFKNKNKKIFSAVTKRDRKYLFAQFI